MKKRLLSILAMASVTLCMQAKVGDDLTSKYLKNADFSQDTPLQGYLCTYDYDMPNNSASMFGQQAVTGWTALNLSDNIQIMETSGSPAREDGMNARAAGVFAIGERDEDGLATSWLGGAAYFSPEFNSNAEVSGNALAVVGVWGASVQYTQTVTLPAGCYTIKVPTYNAGGTDAVAANLTGFIADNGTKYIIDKKAWGGEGVTVDEPWEMDEITFILNEETSGVISLGYQSANAGSGKMPHLYYDYVQIIEADPQPIIQAEIDAAKDDLLLPLLEEGDKTGANTTAGWAVYKDANATLEQVMQAVENQKKLNASVVTDLTDFFLNNAHFAQGTPLDAGVCTYDYDMEKNATKYYGMQPIPYWTGNAPSKVDAEGNNVVEGVNNARAAGLYAVGSGEEVWLGSEQDKVPATKADGSTVGNVFGFISVWSAESYYYQNVTLPAGSYTITIPTYNERGTVAVAKNQCGFVAEDGTEYLGTATTFAVGKWTNETIEFELDDETSGQIRIGYTAAGKGSADMPHLFIDEFTITYNGLLDIKPSLLALQGAVRAGDMVDNEGFEAALYTELEKALEAGKALVDAKSEDDDKNTATATEINNILGQIRTSQAAYVKFETFITKMFNDSEKYNENEDMSALGDQIDKLAAEYDDGFKAGAYSATQIEEMMAGYKTLVAEGVKKAFDTAVAAGGEHNVDITALFTDKNLDYANSNVNGWANETGTSAFLSRVQTAEVWNQAAFNVHQTLENLPAGVYEISMNGYYRTADNATNYPAWLNEEVNGKAYLYAGLNQVLMHNVAEYAVEENDGHHSAEVDGMFFSNSNDDAHYAFYEQNEAVNTVTTALVEAGDLTLGVKGVDLEGNAWVVWGGFTVTYKGTVGMEDALNEQIKNLQVDAYTLYENNFVNLVNKAGEDLSDAISAGDEALDAGVDAKTAAIKDLKEAIAYASKCESTLEKWMDVRSKYELILNNSDIESDDETLNELLLQDPEEGAESLEEVEKIIAEYPIAWSAYVFGQDGVADATPDSPAEISVVILNHSFEDLDLGLDVWNVERTDGDTSIKENANATYTMEGCDGDYLFNTWNQGTVGYAINQDVYLPKGAYTLSCVVATDAEKVITLHAGDKTAEVTTADGVGEDGATIPSKTIGVEVSVTFGTDGGVINLGVAGTETWYKADNFKLLYLGSDPAVGVKDVTVDVKAATGIYDLTGRQVSKAVKGLYIINGKKVIK